MQGAINGFQLLLLFILLQSSRSRGQEESPFHPTSRLTINQDSRQFQDDELPVVAQPPIASSTSASSDTSPSTMSTMPSLYSDYQAQKFRVNVSNLCETNQMHVVIRFNRPFYGLIHTKDKRKRPSCQVKGTGSQAYTLDISYTLVQSEPNYCGVVSHHLGNNNQTNKQPTLSVALIVRLHKTIEFSDDRYFLLSCPNRCQRPDCSSQASNQPKEPVQEAQSGTQSAFKGLIASESIVSPALRSSVDTTFANNTLARHMNEQNSWSSGLLQRCDLTGALRFQWLLKLSWALSALLLVTFLTALYLCIALSNSRRANKRRRGTKQASSLRAIYPSHDSQVSSWSYSNKDDSRSISAKKTEDFEKIREDNSFLAKQHQNIVLNGLSSGQNRQNSHSQVVRGRAAESGFASSNDADQSQRVAQMKRRRSVGSVIGITTSSGPLSRRSTTFGRSGANLGNKSRSQTTIYYDQGQDPFEAKPFDTPNHINSISAHRQLPNGTIMAPPMNQLHLPMDINGNYNFGPAMEEPDANSLPPEININQIMQASSFNELASRPDVIQQLQRYAAFKPTYVAPTIQMIRPPTMHQNVEQSSQFDPQNSRQLIDLIQQKHRQQMAQANRTAASINSAANVDLLESQQRNQHRNKHMSVQSSIWR